MSRSNGKRLLPPPDTGRAVIFCSSLAKKSRGARLDPRVPENPYLACLPDDALCNILSCLDSRSLSRTRCLNRSFRILASHNSAGWDNLCQKLWADKVHVPQASLEYLDRMAAFRISLQDARDRDHVHLEEFLFDPVLKTGTIWSFRFKESAGSDWTSWDPWYRGEPCRKMVFLEDGSVREYTQKSPGVGHGLEDPPFSNRTGDLMNPPMSMTWRFIASPLDMPTRSNNGSYVRFSVGGREVPTYCVRRSPTNNWGFIMESCWGVYGSFELPKRTPRTTILRRLLRRSQDAEGNWFNVEIEVSSDESGSEEEQASLLTCNSRLLIDDETFTITSGLQWMEAFLYNSGSQVLPEGKDAVAEFESAYAQHIDV